MQAFKNPRSIKTGYRVWEVADAVEANDKQSRIAKSAKTAPPHGISLPTITPPSLDDTAAFQ
jgi:hypothetical protein